MRDFITALALCHNVTPTFPNPDNKNIVEYQASSPDEIALVKFAESLEMRLMDRDQTQITIRNAAKDMETYEILQDFPFTSTSRFAKIMKVPTIYYDPTGKILKDDPAKSNIMVVNSIKDLKNWMQKEKQK